MSSPVETFGSPASATPPPSRRVKICGVTQKEQALSIAGLGADYIGLNFWPQSKRYLAPEAAAAWSREVPHPTQLVGVFVNPEADFAMDIAAKVGLSFIQLHGAESPAMCADLAAQGWTVIKAFQVRDASSLDAIADYAVQDILLDAYLPPGQWGGGGHTFPWELALTFKERYPDRTLWLAGGLTPGNVAEAVHAVAPFAVDVAGGVEDGMPGIKSLEKVAGFIEHARSRNTID